MGTIADCGNDAVDVGLDQLDGDPALRIFPQNGHKDTPEGASLAQFEQYGIILTIFFLYKELSLPQDLRFRACPAAFCNRWLCAENQNT